MSSKLYTVIKKYYDNRIYTKEDVELFLEKGKLTKEEYDKIIA